MNKSIALVLALASWTACIDQEGAEGVSEQDVTTNTIERVFAISAGVSVSQYQLAQNAESFAGWGTLGGHELQKLSPSEIPTDGSACSRSAATDACTVGTRSR